MIVLIIDYSALPESIFQSLKKLGEEHKRFLSTKDQSELSKNNMLLNELSEDERKSLPEKVAELTAHTNRDESCTETKGATII